MADPSDLDLSKLVQTEMVGPKKTNVVLGPTILLSAIH
jgi:hypothetical protein